MDCFSFSSFWARSLPVSSRNFAVEYAVLYLHLGDAHTLLQTVFYPRVLDIKTLVGLQIVLIGLPSITTAHDAHKERIGAFNLVHTKLHYPSCVSILFGYAPAEINDGE